MRFRTARHTKHSKRKPDNNLTGLHYDDILQAAGAAVAEQPKTMGFGELFLAGGWLMWVLLVLGALAIYIFVERFIAIRKASKIDQNFINKIRDFIYEGRMEAAVDLCKSTDTPSPG